MFKLCLSQPLWAAHPRHGGYEASCMSGVCDTSKAAGLRRGAHALNVHGVAADSRTPPAASRTIVCGMF
jgi:hypothetical protein